MAEFIKVSETTAATVLGGTEKLLGVQSAATVHITPTQIGTYVRTDGGVPAGAIMPFAGGTAPTSWLSCDGSAVSRTSYAALFAAIGTVWGVGDGSTTFNVPDMRGVVPRGTGTHGSLTKANGGAVAGPAVGSHENDQMLGHKHSWEGGGIGSQTISGDKIKLSTGAGGANRVYIISDGNTAWSSADYQSVGAPRSDGTNGTPRTGDETRPFAAGVLYIIKT